jgi:hypothetical protein
MARKKTKCKINNDEEDSSMTAKKKHEAKKRM